MGFCSVFLSTCKDSSGRENLFSEISPNQTGIDFSNTLLEDEQFNIIEYLYFYNGGGIAVGDINNDDLPDLYFSSNQNANRLYLNKGNFKFEDISETAAVSGIGNWKTGVTFADVNGDGYLDIFSCSVGGYKKFTGRNQLLINNGDLTFSDRTDEYGLNFQGFSTQSIFFDFDNDGDLDMYLLNHSVHSVRSYGDVSLRNQSDFRAGDKLYRNDLVPLGVNKFTEITSQAGIHSSQIGYGLAVSVSDLNNDGYLDIYVSNDFHENDYLYINQGNGTFVQQAEKSLPHTSRFSMGNDVADINNDGQLDIITLDMLPSEESILKTTAGEDPFEIFEYKLGFGYHYQVSRNCLHLNAGTDANKHLKFIDIASFAGVEATDWSWAPLLADFDNDGYNDLFIANGIVRRPNDLDYISFISTDSAQRFLSTDEMIAKMPSGKVKNFFFQNMNGIQFQDKSQEWVSSKPSYSTGAAYVDLDNDGDLDLVLNNINSEASIIKNNSETNNWLTVSLIGTSPNNKAIGAKLIVYIGKDRFTRQLMPTRGWLSSSDYRLHFGLGKVDQIDSILVQWPDLTFQTIKSVKSNQHIKISQSALPKPTKESIKSTLLSSINDIKYLHSEDQFSPFTIERLLPHSLASESPSIALGDINGDKLDDVVVAGAKGSTYGLYIQTSTGFKESSNFIEDTISSDITDAVLVDINNDNMLDLILAKGGQEFENSTELAPALYLGSAKGGFRSSDAGDLTKILVNASCIRPMDYDKDGYFDLFIGGRVVAGSYGLNPTSYLLKNSGNGTFKIVDNLPSNKPGMVTDAMWQDLNADGMPDLVLVGEWMPITIWIQTNNGFEDRTQEFGFSQTNGWWNTIKSFDLDGDGDLDWLVGNHGLNSRLRASVIEPVELWVGDIDTNGSIDPMITYFNGHKSFPFISKDQLIKQVPSLKRKFLKYDDFRSVVIEDILTSTQRSDFVKKQVVTFASVWVENVGNSKFIIHQLPDEAQFFPIFSFEVTDLNEDKLPEILAVGNWFDKQPDLGRQDAGVGLILQANSTGKWQAIPQKESGFWVDGEARSVHFVQGVTSKWLVVGINNKPTQVFKINSGR